MKDVPEEYLWWQNGIIYQVYPRSFQDNNGDGIGDLRGIVGRLDYLQWLGVTALWLSPVYPSPMKDFGYDISDYRNIDPVFGNLKDLDELLAGVHQRGMKLIMDLVPNHTSDQHPWFVESASSRNNPRRDWYLWRDPDTDGNPPNNWLSVFGGSAWEWSPATQQFYYHAFLKEQPDLNWRNPAVQEAMLDVMRFWLEKGVDGFRVDVMWHLIKDSHWRDNPPDPEYQQDWPEYRKLLPVYSTDQPEVHEIVHKMRQLLDSYPQRMMIGEIYLPIQKVIAYYGVDNKGAHLPFNFQLISLPWDSTQIAAAIDLYEGILPALGWPNWVMGNHDQPRITSRVGVNQARVAAMLLLTLRGTPTLYYGDEIGMRDVALPRGEILDPQGLNMPGKNLSRDPARSPMQWDSSLHAGFTQGLPWLRIDSRYVRKNVALQRDDPYSMLSLYKDLITLRQREPALMWGHYHPVYADRQILSFCRVAEDASSWLVILNLSHRPGHFVAPRTSLVGTIELATDPELVGLKVENTIALGGDEGVMVRLEPEQSGFLKN